ncbi:efflux RND transporter periplasmic adaptor subunit [Actinoplanes sp. NPDC049118]|uniref:efflux RND transporter periplasmic adaptor subunit n=1 Tax=Actinoplanes sp. NPDC049118 TaxID=3155769 RepID=UPI0033CA5455
MGEPVDVRRLLTGMGVSIAAIALAGCTSSGGGVETPGLEPRGTVLTTVKPTRQDLTNKISLAGKVTINPVFGIVAPKSGELRYLQRPPTPTQFDQETWVATVWRKGKPYSVEIPAGATLAGRLMEDRSDVTAGMPVVSARHIGYGIVADIDSALAYRISGAAKSVEGQIKNGPGPFKCKPLGTIAALPAGTIPEPPPASPAPEASGKAPEPQPEPESPGGAEGSEPTGLQLVCTAPSGVKLINGAAVTLNLVTGRADNAMVLPVEAIAGTQGRGKVDVVGADRERKTVDVVLGLTDGKVVQIKSGLKGDETIAIPGPNLPTAAPGAEDNPSGIPG